MAKNTVSGLSLAECQDVANRVAEGGKAGSNLTDDRDVIVDVVLSSLSVIRDDSTVGWLRAVLKRDQHYREEGEDSGPVCLSDHA